MTGYLLFRHRHIRISQIRISRIIRIICTYPIQLVIKKKKKNQLLNDPLFYSNKFYFYNIYKIYILFSTHFDYQSKLISHTKKRSKSVNPDYSES